MAFTRFFCSSNFQILLYFIAKVVELFYVFIKHLICFYLSMCKAGCLYKRTVVFH